MATKYTATVTNTTGETINLSNGLRRGKVSMYKELWGNFEVITSFLGFVQSCEWNKNKKVWEFLNRDLDVIGFAKFEATKSNIF